MLRNTLYIAAFRQPNVEVGVVINDVFINIEGVDFDSARGHIVLELDQEALARATSHGRVGNSDG